MIFASSKSFACVLAGSALLLSNACSGVASGDGTAGLDGGSPPNGAAPGDGAGAGGSSSGTAPVTGPDLDSLFGPPTGPVTRTAGSIYGLWSGSANGADVRIKLTPTSITFAKRCWSGEKASGVTVAAVVDASSIDVLESKSDIRPYSGGQSYCNVEVRPISVGACPPGIHGQMQKCFAVNGYSFEVGVELFYGQTGQNGGYGHDDAFRKVID